MRVFVIIFFSFSFLLTKAQLVTGNAMTPTQLVENVLLGDGVTVSNITYQGNSLAIGDFNGVNSNVGLSQGIILSTGTVLDGLRNGLKNGPVGPNNNGGASTNHGGFGDNALSDLVNGTQTFDAAVLEFDFIPQGDTVRFEYVFASEEYLEYVGAASNDVFAFFISGPSIVGEKNIALIPGTAQPVSINNVNAGNNNAYFIYNGNGNSEPQKSDETVINYDGFTVPLTAVSAVTPCQTYHLKIAIADVSDEAFDSGVFLQGGSLNSIPRFNISQAASVDVGTPNLIPEGCSDGVLKLTRIKDLWQSLTIDYKIYGTAQNGVDYTALAESITFPPNEDTVEIVIDPTLDAFIEGNESVIFRFPNPDICESDSFDFEFAISDPGFMQSSPDSTTLNCPGDQVSIDANFSGGFGPYNFGWSTGGNAVSETVAPSVTTDYTFTVTDVCGVSTNNNFKVKVSSFPNIGLDLPSDTTVACAGLDIMLEGLASGGASNYSYSWDIGVLNSSFLLEVTESKTYTLTATDNCSNTISKSINVNLSYPAFNVDVFSDTVVCPGDSVEFVASPSGGYPPYTIIWENGSGDLTAKFASAQSKYVNVSVTDSCGIIPAKDSVLLTIQKPTARFEVNAPRLETDEIIYFVDNSVGNIQSYVWDLGNGETSTASSTSAIYTNDSLYAVRLDVTDDLGCTDSIIKFLNIIPPLYFYLPNTFTPNDDSRNDIFIGKGVGISIFDLTVFNRWGEVMFTSQDPLKGWDGRTSSGDLVPGGVYVYKLFVRGASGKELEKMGTVTLLK